MHCSDSEHRGLVPLVASESRTMEPTRLCPDCGRELAPVDVPDAREPFEGRLAARRNRQLAAVVAAQLRAARSGRRSLPRL